jgi:hypothetical protein
MVRQADAAQAPAHVIATIVVSRCPFFERCRRKYVLSRHHGKTPFYGACGGVNSHRVCNLYGQCWMVCN